MTSIHSIVKEALVSTLTHITPIEIEMHHRLREDLRLDSMGSLMFLMKLEENIKGFVADPATLTLQDLETVSSIGNYIRKQLNEEKHDIH